MKRILIGYADTEGTPHKKNTTSELWNVAIVFKYVIDPNEKPEEIFNVAHLSLNKRAEKKDVKDSLKTHFGAIEFIRKMYDCDEVRVGFWGAGHDMAVLNSYKLGNICPFIPVDLLSIARSKNDDVESFNIGKLCDKFGVDVDKEHKVHTGLGDVLRMIQLFPFLGMDDPNVLVIRQQHKVGVKNKPKTKDEAQFGKLRWNGGAKSSPNSCKNLQPRIKPSKRLQAGAKASAAISTRVATNADIAKVSIELARKLKL